MRVSDSFVCTRCDYEFVSKGQANCPKCSNIHVRMLKEDTCKRVGCPRENVRDGRCMTHWITDSVYDDTKVSPRPGCLHKQLELDQPDYAMTARYLGVPNAEAVEQELCAAYRKGRDSVMGEVAILKSQLSALTTTVVRMESKLGE